MSVWYHNCILGHARSENVLDLNTTQSFDHVICERQGYQSGTDLDFNKSVVHFISVREKVRLTDFNNSFICPIWCLPGSQNE